MSLYFIAYNSAKNLQRKPIMEVKLETYRLPYTSFAGKLYKEI